MRLELEDWKNGWYGVEIGLTIADVEELIAQLHEIRADPEQHFHLSNEFEGDGGVGTVTFFIEPADAPSNAGISSLALAPGTEIEDGDDDS